MPRPPKFSDEEIISTGEKLTAEIGRHATATEIHQALDGLGRFGRIREIWDNYLSAKEQDKKAEIPLAETTLGQISNVVTVLEQSVQDLIQKLIREMTEQNVRQLGLAETCSSAFWTPLRALNDIPMRTNAPAIATAPLKALPAAASVMLEKAIADYMDEHAHRWDEKYTDQIRAFLNTGHRAPVLSVCFANQGKLCWMWSDCFPSYCLPILPQRP